MNKELTCIVCPNGCDLLVQVEGDAVTAVTSALCAKGRDYASQELLHPQRTLSTLVQVDDGESPLVSVRLTRPIPKDRIPAVLAIIQSSRLTAPVPMGLTVCADILGLGSDVITTKAVGRRDTGR